MNRSALETIREFITHRMDDDPKKAVICYDESEGVADIWLPFWCDVIGVEVEKVKDVWVCDFVSEGMIQVSPTAEQWQIIYAMEEE